MFNKIMLASIGLAWLIDSAYAEIDHSKDKEWSNFLVNLTFQARAQHPEQDETHIFCDEKSQTCKAAIFVESFGTPDVAIIFAEEISTFDKKTSLTRMICTLNDAASRRICTDFDTKIITTSEKDVWGNWKDVPNKEEKRPEDMTKDFLR